MNRYSGWKNALILLVLLISCLYALPNLFGEDPSIQITGARNAPVAAETVDTIKRVLQDNQLLPRAIEAQDGRVLVRYLDSETQLIARQKLAEALGVPVRQGHVCHDLWAEAARQAKGADHTEMYRLL